MKFTLIILTKMFLITPPERKEFEKKIQLSNSKFEFAGGVAIGVGWVMSSLNIVNITTAVV